MAYQNRPAGQLPNYICNVLNEIGDSGPAQFFPSFTFTVSTQIDVVRGEAMLSEVIEKMHIPTRSGMKRSVYKKERRWTPSIGRIPGDDFQFHCVPPFTLISIFDMRLLLFEFTDLQARRAYWSI